MHQVKTFTLPINCVHFLERIGQLTGCKPEIVRGGPKGSVIQPFTGWRGNVALIPLPVPGCNIKDTYLLVTLRYTRARRRH